MNIILNLKVEVDSSSVPSSHYHEGLYFFVSEVRSHCNNVGRVLDKVNKKSNLMKVK